MCHPPSPQDSQQSLWFVNNVTHPEVCVGGGLEETVNRPGISQNTCPFLVLWTIQQLPYMAEMLVL